MPAFMSIGKEEDQWVDPGDIKGDVTGKFHKDWMKITSFSVDMKDEYRSSMWDDLQDPRTARARKREEAEKGGGSKGGASKRGNEKRVNTLTVTKPFDTASVKILEWAKSSVMHDIQIDCCTMEEDWPFLSLIFMGVQPTRSSFEDEPSESLEFTWKKALVFTWKFSESGEFDAWDIAEFGEEEVASVSTAAQRGLSDYTPPPPSTNDAAARGGGGGALASALTGALPPIEEESTTYDQERRTITMEKVGSLEFTLESFRAQERLSTMFVYDLELVSDKTKIAPKDVVGHEVKFAIRDEEGREDDKRDPRFFTGIVASFLVGEMASDRSRRYHAVVYPKVWMLSQRSNCRVFQDKTVKEIVEKVFSDAKFSDYDLGGVTKTHPKLPYCVQYNETDLAFVKRLLEEHGIFYFFKHEEKKHTMMLCDGPAGYVKSKEDPLQFDWEVHAEPRVTAWRTNYSFVPGKFAATDYNFETPREPVKAQSQTKIDLQGIKDVEIFEYPGLFPDADRGTTVADLRLQEREVGHEFVHAVSCYDNIAPGMTIAVEGLPGEDPDKSTAKDRFLVTGVRHHAEQMPEYGLSIIGYRNIVTCIPEKVPYTPPRTTPKPRIHGPLTAVVVGDKEKDEDLVDTDKYGRVKVQFHWDREGKKNADSSCWIRVAQSMAGAGYGSVMLPRIGWEVVVSFLDGDPDRPLVTGAVYNELHMPPHELPGAKHKTTIMSRSFPNGNKDSFNELSFHDEKDKEEVYFHAERDFKRVVEHDDVLEVGEKEDGSQTVTVQGDQSITVAKGNRTLAVEKGTETITVKGDRAVTVQSGDYTIDVSSGKLAVTASSEIELKVGGNSVKIDTSSITLKVGGNSIKIDSSGIVQKVGGSQTKVDNMGVELKGMNVKAKGDMQTEVKGMMVSISADAMLKTKGGITMIQ
ncbi:MAG: type VI secretion system tip protein TssI/VgrG [Planctomycetota bacterium]